MSRKTEQKETITYALFRGKMLPRKEVLVAELAIKAGEEKPAATKLPASEPTTVAQTLPQTQTTATVENGGQMPTLELDSNGMPWNAELHVSTRAKYPSGAWRVIAGKGDLNKETIEAAKTPTSDFDLGK